MTKLMMVEKGLRKAVFTNLWKVLDVKSADDLVFLAKGAGAVVGVMGLAYVAYCVLWLMGGN